MSTKTVTLPITREGHTFRVTVFTNDFTTGFAIDEVPGVCDENEDIPLDANERADARMIATDGPKTPSVLELDDLTPRARREEDRAADVYAGYQGMQSDRRAR